MQGLVNFTAAIADGIAVMLPTFCYLAACMCFFFCCWRLWSWSQPHRHHHQHHFMQRPWVPFISLVLAGVFASFPKFLTMANVSAGTYLPVTLGSYTPTMPPTAGNVLGSTPSATVINVVQLFQYFFQAFGAACVFWAIITWRSVINGRTRGSQMACLVQFVFGVMCINVLSVANGVVALFNSGS